jgi:hypothetical protein
MTDALNAPVRRARREQLSNDFPIDQKGAIDMDAEQIERGGVIEHATAEDIAENGRIAELAFQEEPVTIFIHPSSEKNPPLVVQLWVGGKGAEFFANGRWMEANCLPVNMPIITKRKYVEALAMAKMDTINTDVGDATVEHPHNRLTRSTSASHVFSIIEDKNPRGAEWLRRIMSRGH